MSAKIELTGIEKTAVVLMNMDTAVAANILRHMPDDEVEEIGAAIVRLQKVDADVVDAAMQDAHDLFLYGKVGARGGKDVAADLLGLALGGEKAAGLMTRVQNGLAGRSFEFLDTAEPMQVVTLLDGEMPDTIALVLAHLTPVQAGKIMGGFKDPLRTDIAEALANLKSATPEAITLIAQSLRTRAGSVVGSRAATEVVGGVQPLVDIINRASVEMEKAVLAGLDERDPELADEIRSRLLTFADILKLENRDVQQVLRGIDIPVLAIAMKGATDPVQQKIRENLSERNRELLDDEIDSMAPVRQSQVEEARADVVRAIRGLEESGNITLHRGDEDGFVE